MKKKYFWSLLTMIMVAMLSVCFASCSSDDDNDGSFKSSDLVGTWKSIKTETHIYTFNADGTVDGWSTYSHWSYSDGKLYMTRSNNGRIETWLVEYKDNLLYLTLPDGEATEYKTLMKVRVEESDNTENEGTGVSITEDSRFFVGSWLISGAGGIFTFFPNGKAIEYYNNRLSTGLWSYDSKQNNLLTTIELWQFSITAKFDDAWTGYALNTGKVVKADRNNYLNEYIRVVSFSDGTTDPFDMYPIISSWYSDPILSFTNIVINDDKITAIAEAEYRYNPSYNMDVVTIHKHPIVIENPNTDRPILKLDKECTEIKIDKNHNNNTTTVIRTDVTYPLKPGTYQGKWSF